MNTQSIELSELKPAKVNVRKIGGKEFGDLVPSIRALGLLQPLLVRANGEGYEIVAGQRRYHALCKLAKEAADGDDSGNQAEPVPCVVMDDGDDAKAIEASLAENIARLPMDEIDQYKAFAALIKQGIEAGEIAARFGVTERLVTQRLAIANLISPILTAYRKGGIDPQALRLLTMATKTQQKAWLDLYNSDDEYAPEGYRLKCWLFGGDEITTDAALFDLADYSGAIISDLFCEDRYFDNAETFWTFQSAAIAEARDAYLADGWSDVIVLDVGEYFPSYDNVDTAKEDGGKVYVRIASNGEVTFHEGQLSRKEAKARLKRENGQTGDSAPTERPELSQPLQAYLDLHRHAAVRTALISNAGIALRLAIAQIIAGSDLWTIHAEPQKTRSEAVQDSLSDNPAQSAFEDERSRMADLLGIDLAGSQTLVPRKEDYGASRDLHAIFAKLLSLSDEDVSSMLIFVVAESLPCGSAMVEALGALLKVDPSETWTPDDAFFDLMRDKQAINAMLKEIAGKVAADAHIASTAKVQKNIIRDCLSGERKAKAEDWTPRYMQTPMRAYTKRDGIRAIDDWKQVKAQYV